MAGAVDSKGVLDTVALSPTLASVTDEDKCVEILAAFGLYASSVDPAPLAAVAESDDDKCVEIPAAFGLDVSSVDDLAAAAKPLGADLICPSPPRQPGPGVEAGTKATLLPPEVVLEIASRLPPPRSNLEAMRSVCPAWRAAIPNSKGPFLMMSRVLEESEVVPKLVCLQLSEQDGFPSLVNARCVCKPPRTTAVWGATHGFVALQPDATNELCLFCTNCGENMVWLPPLPEGFTTGFLSDAIKTGGIFVHDATATTPYAVLSTDVPRLLSEVVDLGLGLAMVWGIYPGTEALPVCSVAFPAGLRFVAAFGQNVLVEQVGGRPGHNYQILGVPAAGGDEMEPWLNYGTHLFTCNSNTFLCTMSRSMQNVSAAVFRLAHSTARGFFLDRVYDIGQHAVYLGANQALVLPAVQDSLTQRPNTVYILDNDGLVRTGVVWSIHIASGEVSAIAIPFPPGVSIHDYGRAAWVTPPPLNSQFWHCDTKLEEGEATLIEVEKMLHEQEQLAEIELSKQHHAGDLQEKNRLSEMLEHKNAFQERTVQHREAELEEQRIERLREEEEARKREGLDNDKEMWVDTADTMLRIAEEILARQTVDHLLLQDSVDGQREPQDED